MTQKTVDHLLKLAEAGGLKEKIDAMFQAKRINPTENRAVLHPALRAPKCVE
jgi:glucose-6-phosphate isomerase